MFILKHRGNQSERVFVFSFYGYAFSLLFLLACLFLLLLFFVVAACYVSAIEAIKSSNAQFLFRFLEDITRAQFAMPLFLSTEGGFPRKLLEGPQFGP